MAEPLTNLAVVTVDALYDGSATDIQLASGHRARLPNPASYGAMPFVWWDATNYTNPEDDPNAEVVWYTAQHATPDMITVTRGAETVQNGQVTVPSTKNTGASTYKMRLSYSAGRVIAGRLAIGVGTALTVSTNTITITSGFHRVDCTSGDQTVSTINGGQIGDVLLLGITGANYLLLNESGNISIPLGTTFRYAGTNAYCVLRYSGSVWEVVSWPAYPCALQGEEITRAVSGNDLNLNYASVVRVTGSGTVNTVTIERAGILVVVRSSGGGTITFNRGATIALGNATRVLSNAYDTLTLMSNNSNSVVEVAAAESNAIA